MPYRDRLVWLQDYHLHTAITIDGKMNELDACVRANDLGFQDIAFTKHIMLARPDYLIFPDSFCQHWEKIQVCSKLFPHLIIRLGLEMEYYPNFESNIYDTIQCFEGLVGRKFDFVIGSVHEIRGGFFSNQQGAVTFFQ